MLEILLIMVVLYTNSYRLLIDVSQTLLRDLDILMKPARRWRSSSLITFISGAGSCKQMTGRCNYKTTFIRKDPVPTGKLINNLEGFWGIICSCV